MKKFIVVALIFSFLGLQLMGCATMSGTEKGAITGAVAGGILGSILGDTKGAVIGAFAGAIIGAVYGSYYDKQVASRDEAAKKYGFRVEEERIEIESSVVRPQVVTPGSTVDAHVEYTVLAPSDIKQIKIIEKRTLVTNKEQVELAQREVIRTQGTHLSTMRFIIPKDLEKGDYTLITTISNGKHTKISKSTLRVV